MRAAIYVRQSLDRTGEGLGIARQEEECRRLCAYRDWPIEVVVRDNDVSASVGERAGYKQLMNLIKSKSIDAVVVLRIDRLLRKMTDLEELIDLCEETGVTVVTVEGEVNLTTVMGRQIARIMASIARGEVETKSARHKLANEQRAKAGLPHAGRRAFGFENDGLTVREDEALVLKEMAHRFVNGYTYTQLANWMNESGYMTAMGGKWYSVAVRQILQRKRYNGVREHDGVDYPAQWPALWDDDLWARIQHRVRERSASINFRPQPRKYLLTGITFCGSCGTSLNGTTIYARQTGEPRKSYRCNRKRGGCGRVSRGSVPLEWFIRELICYRLDSPELGAMLEVDTSATDLMTKQAALESRLTELLDDYTDGTLSKAEYKRAKDRVSASLEAVRRDLDRLHYDRTLNGLINAGESIREKWDAESDGWRRGLCDLLIERIEVAASRKLPRVNIEGRVYYFDSASISVTWRV